MSKQEKRENAAVEPDNGQLPDEDVLEAEELDSGDVSDSDEAEERDETPEETIARLQSELEEAQVQAASHLDKMQRTVAEYENAGKRRERQNEERIKRASESMLRQLLPVLDDLELAFQNVPEDVPGEDQAWLKGFEQIQQKLQEILASSEVEPLARSGEFDPNQHEAISNEPSEDVPSGHIIQTLRTGYRIQDRILRPALVRVAQ
ncbi:MAG: nucleotide exchange factor GrpE [Caldilineaceae bacterium]|nr:nucleotide exchange factor GrpE [Caldilineaceae bacterium]MCY3990715.1 nucleotide exchange factor GrpE [Caldilineaceae bacterium]MDE0311431.1 nucleotide exchange factor GrpE [Caldilineaceae bacterium]